jgi:hypothetical protein
MANVVLGCGPSQLCGCRQPGSNPASGRAGPETRFSGNADIFGGHVPARRWVSPPVRWRRTSPARPAGRLRTRRPVDGAVAGVQCAVRAVTGAWRAEVPVRALKLEDDPPQEVLVRDRPAGPSAATISSSRFSSSRSDRAATTWQSWLSPFSAMNRVAPSCGWIDHSGWSWMKRSCRTT